MDKAAAEFDYNLIRDFAWDDEQAHFIEDKLYHKIVRELAEYGYDTLDEFSKTKIFRLVEAAKIAVQTEELDFARWCA